MDKKIKIYVKTCEGNGFVALVNNDLKTLQSIVGGYIEYVPLNAPLQDIAIFCNEEGKLLGLPYNIVLKEYNDVLCGTIFFVGVGEEDIESITDAQIEKVKRFIINAI